MGEEKFRQVFEKIVQQCKEKGLIKGKRQIIDSTHIIADMAVTSLTGLIKMCRRNVLRTVYQQNPEIADKLGLKDMLVSKKDKFSRKEDNLEDEIELAAKLLDGVTQELNEKQIMVTPEIAERPGFIGESSSRSSRRSRRQVSQPG